MRYCIFLILTFMCLHLQGQNIKGTVTDNKGIPVPDVAVSDGINIVKTNANGQYAMQSDKHRGTIFVISPSGYTVPLKKEGLQAEKRELLKDKYERRKRERQLEIYPAGVLNVFEKI